MSMRPDPSDAVAGAAPADDPDAREADDEDADSGAARGASLARAARLLSENRTEFSLRWPVREEAAGLLTAAPSPPPSEPAKSASASPPPASADPMPMLMPIPDPENRSAAAPASSAAPRAANRSVGSFCPARPSSYTSAPPEPNSTPTPPLSARALPPDTRAANA